MWLNILGWGERHREQDICCPTRLWRSLIRTPGPHLVEPNTSEPQASGVFLGGRGCGGRAGQGQGAAYRRGLETCELNLVNSPGAVHSVPSWGKEKRACENRGAKQARAQIQTGSKEQSRDGEEARLRWPGTSQEDEAAAEAASGKVTHGLCLLLLRAAAAEGLDKGRFCGGVRSYGFETPLAEYWGSPQRSQAGH